MNLTNCILWGNLAGEDPNQIDDSLGKVTLDYSDIQGGWTGNGSNNIDEDPLFVDAANDDYRLMLGSPCFDTGDPIVPAELVDTYDVDQDGDTDEETPDLDLLDRIVNSLIDMGAYEINCPWDLNGDCVVNTSDLLILFSQWGPPPPPNKPADFNNDGIVNTVDLLILFANWGLCDCDTTGIEPLTLPEELADACLTMDDWNEYVGVMSGSANQATKDRYKCWMEHYLNDCNRCTCLGPVPCPAPDPFDD